MNLRLIPYDEIDKRKWDDCIIACANGLVYSTSAYLDTMCPGWNGVVLNDYEAVMALPWRKKWNIPYLYQPAFFQQGGVISLDSPDTNLVQSFIDVAAEHYRYAAITLNFENNAPESYAVKASLRNNFIIHLKNAQPAFAQKGDYFPKRFRRASKNSLVYSADEDFNTAIKLYQKLYGSRLPSFKAQDYQNFEKICKIFSSENNLLVRKVHHQKQIVALVLLLHFKDRWYNMISCITENGKKLLANYFLYGKLLEELSGRDEILDLEGSDKPGIKFFYEKMADENQPYPFISYNHLPKMIRLFKK